MATRRMISNSISTSYKLSEVSEFAALLFTWAIPHCDDYGHLDATPKVVKALVVPLSDRTVEDVAKALDELEAQRLIERYEADGRTYLEIVAWTDHQTLRSDRPMRATCPPNPKGKTSGTQRATTGIPTGAKRRAKLSKGKGSKDKRSNSPRQSRGASQETQEKNAAEEQPDPEGALINEAIDAFSPVNPSHDRLFRQTPQREAMRRLIRKHGLEKMLRTIKVLPEVNGQPFAPTITTPMQLEAKLGQLIAWYQKHQAEGAGGGKGKEIID